MTAPRHHQVVFERGGETFSDNSRRWLHDSADDDEVSPELIESLRNIMRIGTTRGPEEGK